MTRNATISRKTKETDITVSWDLDTAGPSQIDSGIGFFDHMLEALAKHSGTTLNISCTGDLHIDGHHSTEDTGIVMGQCFREALGDRIGIERFGHIQLPLDEALISATVDISGRPHLTYNLTPPAEQLGSWDIELVPEFFGGFTDHAKVCLHINQISGRNSHHIVEAAFKAFARVLREAIQVTGTDIPSTKGML